MAKNATQPDRQRMAVIPTTASNDAFALATHQEAENALSMSLHYLRSNTGDLSGATRKAVQALGALNRLHAFASAGAGGGGGVSTMGRA